MSVVAPSPCGRFLAGGCKNGVIIIWNIATRKCLNRYTDVADKANVFIRVHCAIRDYMVLQTLGVLIRICMVLPCSDQHDKKLSLTALAWNPKSQDELLFCDSFGNLGMMEGVLPLQELKQVRRQEENSDVIDALGDCMF